jgi:hypothetical protein
LRNSVSDVVAFRVLHGPQAGRMFSMLWVPPRLRGTR